MLSLLATLLGGVVNFLLAFLPDSPLRAASGVLQGVEMGMGWLNWLVPVGDMLGVFTAWCAALLVWYGVQLVVRRAREGLEMVGA